MTLIELFILILGITLSSLFLYSGYQALFKGKLVLRISYLYYFDPQKLPLIVIKALGLLYILIAISLLFLFYVNIIVTHKAF